jgi:hypothetical protein
MLAAAAKDALENGNKESSQKADQESIGKAPIASASIFSDPSPSASRFSGKYFGFEGRTLHTWEFYESGTFLHTTVASGAGTSVRSSERGRYRLLGDTLELKFTSSASGFVTLGIGHNNTILGGDGEGGNSETRKLKVQITTAEKGIILDGIKLKPKSW